MTSRHTSRPIGEVLGSLVSDLGIGKRLQEYDAVLEWAEIVGPHIARVATAEKISQGVLVVRVSASTWRNELNMRKAELLDRLNTALGGKVVTDIRFR